MQLRAMAALVPLVVLTVAGCGISAHVDVTQGPTKAQFISEADAICAAGNAKMRPLRGQLAHLDVRSIAAIQKAVAIQQSGAQRMRALPEPAGDSSTLHLMLTSYESADQAGLRLASALAKHEPQGEAEAIRANNQAHAYAQGVARGYGFRVCGTGGR